MPFATLLVRYHSIAFSYRIVVIILLDSSLEKDILLYIMKAKHHVKYQGFLQHFIVELLLVC